MEVVKHDEHGRTQARVDWGIAVVISATVLAPLFGSGMMGHYG